MERFASLVLQACFSRQNGSSGILIYFKKEASDKLGKPVYSLWSIYYMISLLMHRNDLWFRMFPQLLMLLLILPWLIWSENAKIRLKDSLLWRNGELILRVWMKWRLIWLYDRNDWFLCSMNLQLCYNVVLFVETILFIDNIILNLQIINPSCVWYLLYWIYYK